MTQKDPASRLSVTEYLDILQGKVSGLSMAENTIQAESASLPGGLDVFPPYFDTSLYPLFLKMHWNGATPDERVGLICQVCCSDNWVPPELSLLIGLLCRTTTI